MNLLIFTGPSGGHFFPALAFSEAFKKRYPESRILFVTGRRGQVLAEKASREVGGAFELLPDFPFPRPRQADFIVRLFPFLLKLSRAFSESGKILNSFRPVLVVGFGSYVTFPGLVESRKRKIPILIHEQNRKMGRANGWLTRFADRIALTFEEKTLPAVPISRVRWTGLPLRRSLLESSSQRKRVEPPLFTPGRLRILLVGGSQGSHSLNQLWKEAVGHFSDEEKRKIAVIHITGEKDFEAIKFMYPAQGIEARVFSFHDRMEEIYPEADLAITRSGASTLFELALFGIPSLILPYPHADAHQEVNARYFAAQEGIVQLSEEDCTPVQLKAKVFELVNSERLRNRLSERMKQLALPDASERLVDVAEDLLGIRSGDSRKREEVLAGKRRP